MLILRKVIITWMFPYLLIYVLNDALADKPNTVQMQTRLAKVGFSTEITCSFNFPDRDYYIIWYKHEKHLFTHEPAISLKFRIDGRIYTINEHEETAILGIQKVRVGDAGEYYCKAVPTFVGKPIFQYWKINVQDGPIIAPTRSVMENETFSAQCCVTFTYSTEPVKYLWSLGIPLATTFTKKFDGNVTCSNVSFTAVRGFHNKLLVCTIQNELNSSTHKRINVIDKQNTVQRQTKLAKVGFSTEITCSIDFLDRNYFVIWYKNGKYLFEHEPRMSLNLSRDGRIYTRNEQEDIALLRIQNVSVRDAGEYHCKAVHTFVGKPMFQYWKINVQDGPILSPIRSVRENETFSAQCCVTFTYSTEPVKYLWSIGNPLTTTFSDNFGGNLTCSNVSFTAFRAFHNKLLVCTIENELNSSTHERINLM